MAILLADYQCNTCKQKFEYYSMNEKDLPGCPECGSMQVKRIPSLSHPTKCHDPAARNEILKKRSADHSKPLIEEKLKQLADKKR